MTSSRATLLSATRALQSFGFYVTLMAIAGVSVDLATGNTLNASVGISATLTSAQKVLAARVESAQLVLAMVLSLPVLRLLRAIVDSAERGDPFVPENGVRLRRIGWLILAFNVVSFAASFLLPPFLRSLPAYYPGLFTALLVFVLARIFETGTRMRTEIQETI